MSYAMLDIMNAALISQGQYEISDNDGSDEFRLLSKNWPLIVEAELEDGNYRFTREQMTLSSRSAGRFGFADAYARPGTALFVRDVWYQDTDGTKVAIDWAQDSAKIYVDRSTGVECEYLVSADPGVWTATFARGVQLKLEALIARAIKEEPSQAIALEQLSENFFQRARTNSSRGRSTTDPFLQGRIAASRFRRRV